VKGSLRVSASVLRGIVQDVALGWTRLSISANNETTAGDQSQESEGPGSRQEARNAVDSLMDCMKCSAFLRR
jgi:hypothetical protein